MAFTVDTVQLRYKVTGDYDDKQIGEIRADMKDLEKKAGATRRAIDKSSEAYRRLGDEIAEATRREKELAEKRTRTADEEKELAALIKRVGELNRRREEQKNKMAALSDEYRKQTTDLQGLQAKLNKHVETIGLENVNLKELTRRQREYRAILNSTKPNTQEFQEYAEKLREVNEQIRQTKAAMEGTQDSLGKFDGKGGFLKNLLGAKLDFGQLKTFVMGSGLVSAATFIADTIGEYAGRALDRVKELVAGSIDAARQAEGISRAFKALKFGEYWLPLRPFGDTHWKRLTDYVKTDDYGHAVNGVGYDHNALPDNVKVIINSSGTGAEQVNGTHFLEPVFADGKRWVVIPPGSTAGRFALPNDHLWMDYYYRRMKGDLDDNTVRIVRGNEEWLSVLDLMGTDGYSESYASVRRRLAIYHMRDSNHQWTSDEAACS